MDVELSLQLPIRKRYYLRHYLGRQVTQLLLPRVYTLWLNFVIGLNVTFFCFGV